MKYTIKFDPGDLSSVSESQVDDIVGSSVQPPNLPEINVQVESVNLNNSSLAVDLQAGEELDVQRENYLIDYVSGVITSEYVDAGVTYKMHKHRVSEYTPELFEDTFASMNDGFYVDSQGKDYIQSNFSYYSASTVEEGEEADQIIITKRKPIGVEVRISSNHTRDTLNKIEDLLPFNTSVYLTQLNKAEYGTILVIKYTDEIDAQYTKWFTDDESFIHLTHPLTELLDQTLGYNSTYEFNEMNEGSLLHKIVEGGYSRPW